MLSSLSLWERARVRVPMKVALAPEYLAFVRQLRREQTDAEKLLWSCLCGRQLCVELDGGQHYESAGVQHDEQRQISLTSHGIHTLRFSNKDVLQHLESVLLQIVEAIKPLTPTLSHRERE
jgi:very-short-patch-repair endonuclease